MRLIRRITLLITVIALLLMAGCLKSPEKVKNNVNGGFCGMKDEIKNYKEPDVVYKEVQALLDEGKSLDLTDTEIEISKPLILHNQDIYGGKITYTGNDGQPVLKISGKCVIDTVTIENLSEDPECGEAKYVGIWLSNEKGTVTNGSVIRSVYFKKCGTMIYAPDDVEAAVCGTVIENIRGEGWTFRGIDIQSPKCNNNSYCNIYLNSNYYAGTKYNISEVPDPADSAFFLNGSVSTTIKQLNVEHVSIKQPIVFNNCSDLNISTLHVEGVKTASEGRGYINFSKTSGRIGAVSFYWTREDSEHNGVVVLDDSSDDGNDLYFETFLVKGLNDPVSQVEGVGRGISDGGLKLFARDSKFTEPYYVTIENYVYFTYQDDRDMLEKFYSDFSNISFKKIGQLPAGGTSDQRPVKRLCAGYTEYFDTTLGKLVVWNGENWE